MESRPIIFSGPMVRAILEGRKTQTRRPLKPQPICGDDPNWIRPPCPYGEPGDRLWVRESTGFASDVSSGRIIGRYLADGSPVMRDGEPADWWYSRRLCPSIHMPRWASRITLEITDIRVERLQKISREDAIAEGAREFPDLPPGRHPYGQDPRWSMEDPIYVSECLDTPRAAFANYWCKVNGKKLPGGVLDSRPWDENPWVWVVEFRRVS